MDYAKTRDRATKQIAKFGRELPLARGGTKQVIGGKEVTTPIENHTVIGVVTSYKPSEIDGSRIMNGDIKLAATAETEIRVGDSLMIDGKKYRVVLPGPVKPADILISYIAQLRA